MKIEQVDPCAVAIPHRLRAVDPAKVKQIGDSMAAIGLQQPITVFSPIDGECELIAGAHRLQAAVDLGWDWIDCVFHDDWSEIDRQLWEIDENLMRAELTPTQTAEHLAKRSDLWKKRGQSSPTFQSAKPGEKGFAADTAEKTGVSKRTVNQALARATAIPEDVRDMIRGTKLDKGIYLDGLKGMDPDAQRAKVRANLVSSQKATTTTVVDADAEQLESLKKAWNRAASEPRRQFLDWLEEQETPVFDQGEDAAQ